MGNRQVLWVCTGRNKTLPPSTSISVIGEKDGVSTASLGECLHSSKSRARWAEGFNEELNGHVFDLESADISLDVSHVMVSVSQAFGFMNLPIDLVNRQVSQVSICKYLEAFSVYSQVFGNQNSIQMIY